MGASVSVHDLPEDITLEQCQELTREAIDTFKSDQYVQHDSVPRQVFLDQVKRVEIENLPPEKALKRIMNLRMKLELNWDRTDDVKEWTNVEVDEEYNITHLNLSSPDTYHGLIINMYELGTALLGEHLRK